jgi:hypothetical protein
MNAGLGRILHLVFRGAIFCRGNLTKRRNKK